MPERFRQIWFPGLLATLVAFMGQMIIFDGMYRQGVFHIGGVFMFISVPWLVVLIGCGAVGAYCCYREGGTPRQRLLAGMLPSLVNLVVFVTATVTSFALDSSTPFRMQAAASLNFLTWAVILPCISLLIGATPFVAVEQFSHEVAVHEAR